MASLLRCRQFEQPGRAIRSTLAHSMPSLGGNGSELMRDILEYCVGGIRRNVSAGTEVLHEGARTGHLYVLIEGRLEVVKGETVVATMTEPGAIAGEMSVLLDMPHTATVRAVQDSVIYEIDDAASFLRQQPAMALIIARMLAQRLNVATTYLADLKRQYGGH